MQHYPFGSGCTKLSDQTARFKFALGSASGKLQEVLVTDLPRSFDRGEKRPAREEGEKEMKETERGGGGGAEMDRFFNFHCAT